MGDQAATLLVVDDEDYNLKIIERHLRDEGYRIVFARDGNEAWKQLDEAVDRFDAVLLDRIMPGMTGLDVLRKVKSVEKLKALPVIFQTSMNEEAEIREGLQAGAYYYLTKPYKKTILRAVVQAAVNDYRQYKSLMDEVRKSIEAVSYLESGRFKIRTLNQGEQLAALLARFCPEPKKAVMGLWELIANGVEHGNLGITYAEKSHLNETNALHQEIERRMALPENAAKTVDVSVAVSDGKVEFTIVDQGPGFDWQSYLELSPERAFDSHGRGIAMAGMFSFHKLEYKNRGNEVTALIYKG